MPDNIIVSEIEREVCTITLDRPEKKNALSIALRDEVTSALNDLAADVTVKAVVITGSSGIFSAGFDLGEFQQAGGDAEFSAALWASSDRFHHACLFFPLPLVAAVNGPAIAGGFDLATMCDIRIASDTAYFSHPEISFGDVLVSPLHDLVGGSFARELCLTGRKLDVEEAHQRGLVAKVVESDQLEAAVQEYTAMITAAPRENLMRTKAKLLKRAGIDPGETLSL